MLFILIYKFIMQYLLIYYLSFLSDIQSKRYNTFRDMTMLKIPSTIHISLNTQQDSTLN